MKNRRLDEALVAHGLARDTDEAKRLVMAGLVLVDERPFLKPGMGVDPRAVLRLRAKARPYASRGGLKLAAALDRFGIDVTGKTALDLGASTGGFTDCLLTRGAAKVFAVDVGTNQLLYRLRQDPRVVSLERTHAKLLSPALITAPIGVLSVDVSFTALSYVLDYCLPLLEPGAALICLFKPQFEVPRQAVGSGGIVRDPAAVEKALDTFRVWVTARPLSWIDQMESPITGQTGNLELLIHLRFDGSPRT